jgi:hypothetical protein
MNFRNQRAGGINNSQVFGRSPDANVRRNAVRAENDQSPRRELVDIIHKNSALGCQRLDHVLVMNNLAANVNGGWEKLERRLNYIDSSIHTRAESTRLGEY